MLECVEVTLMLPRQRGRSPLIIFELPESNWYWKQYQVMDFCIEFGLDKYLFQGCMYDMRAPSGPHEGMLLRKGWCIATNAPSIGKAIETRCIHSPEEHTLIHGDLTRGTESYPQLVADKVHWHFRDLVEEGWCA